MGKRQKTATRNQKSIKSAKRGQLNHWGTKPSPHTSFLLVITQLPTFAYNVCTESSSSYSLVTNWLKSAKTALKMLTGWVKDQPAFVPDGKSLLTSSDELMIKEGCRSFVTEYLEDINYYMHRWEFWQIITTRFKLLRPVAVPSRGLIKLFKSNAYKTHRRTNVFYSVTPVSVTIRGSTGTTFCISKIITRVIVILTWLFKS